MALHLLPIQWKRKKNNKKEVSECLVSLHAHILPENSTTVSKK